MYPKESRKDIELNLGFLYPPSPDSTIPVLDSRHWQRFLHLLRDPIQIPLKLFHSPSGQHPTRVTSLYCGVILEVVTVDIGQLASSCMQDGLRGTRVPFLAAWTAEDVRVGSPL